MRIGYARVSTESQKLEAQIEQLKRSGIDRLYSEKWTGTTVERPAFEALLAELEPGDTLVVTKLDRFARNTREALDVMQGLFDDGIAIDILNMGRIDESPTGKLIFTVFSAFSQFERDLIVTRTQEGKAYARKHNPDFREGREALYSDNEIKKALQVYQSGLPLKKVAVQTGISLSTLKRRFKMLS